MNEFEAKMRAVLHRYHALVDEFVMDAWRRDCFAVYLWTVDNTVHLSTQRPEGIACTRFDLEGQDKTDKMDTHFQLYHV